MVYTPYKRAILLANCLVTLIGVSIVPITHAQVENLSKLPNLSLDIKESKDYQPIVMPEDYPTELASYFDQEISSRSFIVVDRESKRILAQRSANVPYPIASTTKILTAYLVYQAIEQGKIDLQTEIEAPTELTKALSETFELTSTPLYAGEKYTVKDLLYALIMKSGNDAASLLMIQIYGSESNAVQAMKEQLEAWGIDDFDLYTSSGVPNEYIPEDWRQAGSSPNNENALSAQDLALVTAYTIDKYPQILEIAGSQDYLFKQGTDYEQTITTPNPFLPGRSLERDGVTGLKSGLTDGAGDCFVLTGKENGREIIAISLGNFYNEDGSFSSSYDQLTLILDALKEYPDLYKNQGLPINDKPSPEELQAIEASQQAEADANQSEEETKEKDPLTNHRDHPITQFFGKLFQFLR